MGKSIDQFRIEGTSDRQYIGTYKTIVAGKPRTLYEAVMATDAVLAREALVLRLRGKGISFQIMKVEEFISE